MKGVSFFGRVGTPSSSAESGTIVHSTIVWLPGSPGFESTSSPIPTSVAQPQPSTALISVWPSRARSAAAGSRELGFFGSRGNCLGTERARKSSFAG